MKGTLFSADFVQDSNDNLRLIEINTDTAIHANGIQYLDFSGFIEILSGSALTKIKIVQKRFHDNLVSAISESVQQSGLPITEFTTILEEDATIYPTSIDDATDTFILRMAYDEAALFDSEYAKDKKGVLELFSDSGDSGSIAEYYVSSSTDGVSDYLSLGVNSTNSPDFVVKDLDNTNTPLSFYKLGKSSETLETRYTEFKESLSENEIALKFYENTSVTKVKSFRSINIIYGSNLDVLNLGNYAGDSLLEKPSSIHYDDSIINNKINVKHYYEFATSYPRFTDTENWGGIFEEEEIVKADGTTVLVSSASVGDDFKSYYIEGTPDTDIVSEFMEWSHPGSELPSGSYVTSSTLINNIEQPLTYGLVSHVVLEDSSDFRASASSHLLTYEIASDSIRYETLNKITPATHKLISLSSGTVNIQSVTYEVLDGEYKSNILDMETADTFFLSNGELSVKIVTHNCFPAGTKITLADGSQKNIEDLTTKDKILTWNEHTSDTEEGTIGNIVKKDDNLLIHLTTNHGDIKSTSFHKFYVKGKRWTAAQDITIGDILINSSNEEVIVTDRTEVLGNVEVYHILDVKDNHTYFANNLLVHNFKYSSCFPSGTKISLYEWEDGENNYINIEDILVGDKIKTFNLETGITELGEVGELKEHKVPTTLEITFDDNTELVTTPSHPLWCPVRKKWIPAGELLPSDFCINENGDEVQITTIDNLEGNHTVYNLLTVTPNHNFFANGILVHNKF